jgi:sterol desaturase/sphingolipid hydroxylase (fatty acid hydroxylase superfamily)
VTIFDWLNHDYLPQLLDDFVNPQKRVSITYLASAAVIAVIWSVCVSRGATRDSALQTRRKIFGQKIWCSRSAFGDYKLLIANKILLLIVAPFFVSKIVAATAVFFFLNEYFPAGSAVLATVPPLIVAISYTVFLFVLDDFSRFATHLSLHRIPCLWVFHKIHHSAETLNPLTVFRTHPVESVLFSFRAIAVQSLSIALFVFLFGSSVDLISIYGVNFVLFIFNLTGANLRHSHIQLRYGAILERVFISPAQHQIHHSIDPNHHNRNFGAALAVWDWMAGSLCVAHKNLKLEFGLSREPVTQSHGLINLYITPFRELLSPAVRWSEYGSHNPRNRRKHAG